MRFNKNDEHKDGDFKLGAVTELAFLLVLSPFILIFYLLKLKKLKKQKSEEKNNLGLSKIFKDNKK